MQVSIVQKNASAHSSLLAHCADADADRLPIRPSTPRRTTRACRLAPIEAAQRLCTENLHSIPLPLTAGNSQAVCHGHPTSTERSKLQSGACAPVYVAN